MTPMLHQVAGFAVGMMTHVTSRAKNADAAPKHSEKLAGFHRSPQLRERPIDSGSESDLVSKGSLRDINAQNCRAAEHPISLITAHGSTEANEVADVKLSALPDPVQPYVLDQTPAVLSVGTRCLDRGL